MSKWWDRWPGRLEWELQKLDEAGIQYVKDEEAFENANGALHLKIKNGEFGGENFTVVFPAYYPFMRFEIYSDEINLDHHQNPFLKNLCFIGRASENWHSTDNVANFLTIRLPKVIQAGMANDPSIYSDLEEKQAEPFSEYYTYLNDCVVLFDSLLTFPKNENSGVLTIKKISNNLDKFIISDIKNAKGNLFSQFSYELRNIECRDEMVGQWTRIDKPIKINDPDQFYNSLKALCPAIKPSWYKCNQNLKIAIHCVIFPEEIDHRDKGEGFIFLLRVLKLNKGKFGDVKNYFVRTDRCGKDDLAARNPIFKNLKNKKIAVIGLGCLGAPATLEFARCGIGELRILDYDRVESGTIIRWPFGLDIVGKTKVDVLAEFISKNYPYTKTIPFSHRLGEACRDYKNGMRNDVDVIENLLADIDLIYDAGAELGIQHLLSTLAKERKIPYISTSTTFGAWSGSIVRIHPAKTIGCWECYRHWLTGGQISGQLQDPKGKIQPAGCASPTFTGGSFDTQEYALGGVRLAISTLTEDIENGYPEINWDVANIYLRNSDGEHIPPEWKTYSLQQHPECSCKKNLKK